MVIDYLDFSDFFTFFRKFYVDKINVIWSLDLSTNSSETKVSNTSIEVQFKLYNLNSLKLNFP